MQSENLFVISLSEMDWKEVVASVFVIIMLLNSVGYWRAMFIIEFYVPRFFLVL